MNSSPCRMDASSSLAAESSERQQGYTDRHAEYPDIKVHRLRIDGTDPLALVVELLRKL